LTRLHRLGNSDKARRFALGRKAKNEQADEGKKMEEHTVLDLIANLCRILAAQKIDYCHWKSNSFLARSASGDNDLDLLVSRNHAQCFAEILFGLKFKESLLPVDEELPGVRNYYGCDQKTGRLVHVHAHFQLILGNDLSKNYRLPLEKVYLESSTQGDLFRVPSPEFELVVLVIRMALKHSTWDSLLMRHGQLSTTERVELNDLSTQETLSKVETVLCHLPGLSRELFDLCLRSLQPGCRLSMRIKAGEQLQRALKPCARTSHLQDVILKFSRRIGQFIQRRIFRYKPKNSFANGGLFIAIVGGDGAGKTTVIDELDEWLSAKFRVKKLHLGKPAWSWMTTVIRGILKMGTLLRLYPFEGDTYEESLQPHGYPWFIRAVCTARDRYLTYKQARRLSSNGSIVLCDRYSFPGFMKMDGPQCEQAVSNSKKTGWLLRFLVNTEKYFYQQIKLPDLLIVLKADPEITVRRKKDETQVSVRARSLEVWSLDWKKLSAFEVNANRSKEESLAEVKNIFWEHL
jgi:thymidylate kinase